MKVLTARQITVGEYLVLSTVASIFLQQKLARSGVDIFLGYPLIVINTLVLWTLNRLYMHPKHFAVIAGLAVFSIAASHTAGTPVMAIAAQILGISLMSVYFFSVLTGFNMSLSDWMNVYSRFAFAVAVFGILFFPFQRFIEDPGDAARLHSIFSEPSFFVYLTLPAVGWYFNRWLGTRSFGLDLLVFALSYALADSSLGFLGLGLMILFTVASRLSIWKTIGAGILGCVSFVTLFFVSSNFRLRVIDMFFAVSSSDLSKSDESTFAVLSNAYVTFRSFMDHPLMGVGIGGYRYQYQHYIGDLSGIPKNLVDLDVNMFDASSLFMRSLTELGILGPLSLIAFLIIFGAVKGVRHVEIRNALLPFFLVRMARYGSYFSLELFFFVAIYLLNFLEYRMNATGFGATMSGHPNAHQKSSAGRDYQ
jgi:hypothetical protein